MIDFMLNYFLGLLQCFMNFFIAFNFLNGIFEVKSKRLYVNLPIIGVCALLLSYINCFRIPIYNTIAVSAIMILMLCIIFKGKLAKLFFSGLLIVAIIIGCEFIPLAALSSISQKAVAEVATQTIQVAGFSFISTSLFFVLTIIAKFLLNRFGKLKIGSENRFSLALIPMPILSVFIAYYIVKVSALAKFSDALIFDSIAIIMCLIVVNIIVFASDSDARKKHEYKAQIAQMLAQGERKEALILQQDANYNEMNNLVHDFKHQLLTLQMQINETQSFEEQQRISDNISSVIENLPSHKLFPTISCSALRCILIHTHNECQRLGINFTTKICFSDFNFISYQDICTIFSNAFENAICACEEMRRQNLIANISIQTKQINEMVSVHIRNDKINEIKEYGKEIVTSKLDKTHHGIGLSNIKRATQKYGGTVQTSYTDTEFTIGFLFTLPSK